jgi:hypothetical protein
MAEIDTDNAKWKNDSEKNYNKAIEIASTIGKTKKAYLGLMLN